MSVYAPIAQLDRVTDYESVGRGFESLSAYQKFQIPKWVSGIFYMTDGLERAAPVRTLVQKLRAGEQFLARGRVLWSVDASALDVDTDQTFLFPPQGQKCKRVPSGVF